MLRKDKKKPQEKRPIPNTIVAQQNEKGKRPIPSTFVSNSDVKRAIPDTVVSNQGGPRKPIPSTIVSQHDKRAIPDTVVSNKSDSAKNKRIIPNTVLTDQIMPDQKNDILREFTESPLLEPLEPLLEPLEPILEALEPNLDIEGALLDPLEEPESEIFAKFSDMVSPIITDPEGIEEMQDDSYVNTDVESSQISICSYCQAENAIYNKKCQVCSNPLPSIEPPYSPIKSPFQARLKLLQKNKEKVYYLSQQENLIGRDKGHITFSNGQLVSGIHAKLYYYNKQLAIVDLNSLNGTYIKLRSTYNLMNGDIFTVGQQLFQFQILPTKQGSIIPSNRKTRAFISPTVEPTAKLVYFVEKGGYDITLIQNKTVIGREEGNLIFSKDDTLSSPHVAITKTSRGYALQDLESKNGTWIRIKRPTLLKHNDMLRIGEYIFSVHIDDVG